MIKDEIIEKYIKVFVLVQVKKINQYGRQTEFKFNYNKTAFCLGTIVNGTPIVLVSNKIYPVFKNSLKTKLNTYYLLDILDYGTMIPVKDKLIVLEDDSEKLKEEYLKTVEWYHELIKNEEQNIKSFEKEKAKILEK